MENPQVPKTSLDYCLNCNHALDSTDAYCSSCGQKTRESRISSWQLISEFFKSILNIDSKFFKSISLIFFPSRLTSEYIQGRRRSYINPSRFFFVSLIIHFGLLTLITKDKITIQDDTSKMINQIRKDIDHAALQASFDSLIINYPLSNAEDTDSLKHKLLGPKPNATEDSTSVQIFGDGESGLGSTFAKKDLVNLSSDEFVKKYGNDSFLDNILVRQAHRFFNDSKGATQFLIGNLLWVIVLLALFTAFFLKLLYIRRKYFLVDHLILSMFMHSFLLLTLSLYYLFEFYITNGDGFNSIFSIGLIAIPLYAFLSMKHYYKQGWFKTIVKFILLSFYQLIILVIFAVIVILVSLLIF